MELTLTWFWMVNSLGLLITMTIVYYVVYKHKLKSKRWNILAIVWLILATITPIKIDGTKSTQYKTFQTSNISQSKVLPEKVEASSWKKNEVNGITKKDLE